MTYIPPTAQEIVTGAMRLFGIIDTMEAPTTQEATNATYILNDLLRAEHQDAASQYFITRFDYTLPQGQQTFSIGDAQSAYEVQKDVVGVRRIDAYFGGFIRREIYWRPMADIVRTLQPGLITKAHQERQVDGSVLVTVWQVPSIDQKLYIEVGGRIPYLNGPSALVMIPPEAEHAVKHILGLRLLGVFGRKVDDTQVAVQTAKVLEAQWLNYARGLAWTRLKRGA